MRLPPGWSPWGVLFLFLAAAPPLSAEESDWVLAGRPRQRIQAVAELQIEAPELRAEEWIAAMPVAPTLPRQRSVTTALEPAGREILEPGGWKHRMLRVRLPVTEEEQRRKIAIRAAYRAELWERRLVRRERIPAGLEPLGEEKLSAAEREAALREDLYHNFSDEAFRRWRRRHELIRRDGESSLAFARRAFLHVVEHTEYAYPPPPRDAAGTCGAGRGDCGSMCVLLNSLLRAEGIPARSLVGRWAQSSRTEERVGGIPYAQYHVKSEFHIAGLGWVPADPSVAVTSRSRLAPEHFFGNDSGDFFVQHLDLGLAVDSAHFGVQRVESCQRPPFWARGGGSFAGVMTVDHWTVEAHDLR